MKNVAIVLGLLMFIAFVYFFAAGLLFPLLLLALIGFGIWIIWQLWQRRRKARDAIGRYRQKLDEWEQEGYDVSEFKRTWSGNIYETSSKKRFAGRGVALMVISSMIVVPLVSYLIYTITVKSPSVPTQTLTLTSTPTPMSTSTSTPTPTRLTTPTPTLTPTPTAVLVSSWATTPVQVDGVVSTAEWQLALPINATYGWLLIKNDAVNLYILIDVTADTYDDNFGYFSLIFDIDRNKEVTPGVDLMYGLCLGKLNISHLLGPSSVEGCVSGPNSTPNTLSQYRQGFGPSSYSATSHLVWECAIRLAEVKASPGETVRLGVSFDTYFQGSEHYVRIPPSLNQPLINLMEIRLAVEP